MAKITLKLEELKKIENQLNQITGSEGLNYRLNEMDRIIGELQNAWVDPNSVMHISAIEKRRDELKDMIDRLNAYKNILKIIRAEFGKTIESNINIAKKVSKGV